MRAYTANDGIRRPLLRIEVVMGDVLVVVGALVVFAAVIVLAGWIGRW